jgi:hypothetical protein
VAGAVETRPQLPGSRRFIRSTAVPGAVSDVAFDVLRGAWITTRLRLDTWGRTAATAIPEVLAEARADAAVLVGHVSRPVLAAALAQRSHGRLHLDPSP